MGLVLVAGVLSVCAQTCKHKRGVKPGRPVIEQPALRQIVNFDAGGVFEDVANAMMQVDSVASYLRSLYEEMKDSLAVYEALPEGEK